MNESGFKSLPVIDEILCKELEEYGSVLGQFSMEDSLLEEHEVIVYELDKRKYWMRKLNYEVVELREIT